MSDPTPSMHPEEPQGPATPAQQKILHRIAAQRERIQARRKAYAQANSAAEAGAAGMALGPSRLVRWASVALPWILRFRR